MKFAVRRILVLAVGFHVLAYLYVMELLKERRAKAQAEMISAYAADHSAFTDVLTDLESYDNETLVDNDDLVDMELDVLKVVTLEDRIQGMGKLLEPYLDALEAHREKIESGKTDSSVKWNSMKPTANKLHADDYNLFKILRTEFPQIRTLPLVMDIDELEQYLLPSYYHYSSNNCRWPQFALKGSQNVLSWFYNASCKAYIADTLRPVPFKHRSRSLRIWNYAGYLKDPSKIVVTYLTIVPNAVVDKYGDVTSGNVTLVPDRCEASKGWSPKSSLSDLPLYKQIFTIHQKYGRDLAHNSLENLARLAPFVSFLKDNPRIMIQTGYTSPYLELLGLSPKRAVTADGSRASTVYMPAGTHCETPALLNTQLLSFHLRQGLHNLPEERDTVILLKDTWRDSEGGYARLYQDVLGTAREEAQKRDLLMVEYKDVVERGLASTRELFNRALVVIAVRSTQNIVNMYFSQPGTVLMEGLCQNTASSAPSLSYAAFAQTLGLRYFAVVGQAGCAGIAESAHFKMALKYYLSKMDYMRTSDIS